jgi:hypothetical protein
MADQQTEIAAYDQFGRPIPKRRSRSWIAPTTGEQYPVTEASDDSEESDSLYPTRTRSSALRYSSITAEQPQVYIQGNRRLVFHHGLPPTRQTTHHAPPRNTEEPEIRSTRRRFHWLLFVAVFLLVMLLGWVLVNVLLNWWQVTQDDWQYGRPRTFQVDQRVGHADEKTPTHFVAMNLNHHVQIIECPASDCTRAIVYTGPQLYGDQNNLMPVTLSFKDVNGDGKPDMIVHVGNQVYVFINDGSKFRPARPDEHLSL